jgi:hypothetical protein
VQKTKKAGYVLLPRLLSLKLNGIAKIFSLGGCPAAPLAQELGVLYEAFEALYVRVEHSHVVQVAKVVLMARVRPMCFDRSHLHPSPSLF